MRQTLDLVGASVTVGIYVLCILVFVFRLVGKPSVGHGIGWVLHAAVVPLVALVIFGRGRERQALYDLQIALMLGFLAVEFLLDYWPKVDFRHTQWIVVPYVMLFFGGTGGMLGVASAAGRAWTLPAVALYFVMAALAFVQRRVTGT